MSTPIPDPRVISLDTVRRKRATIDALFDRTGDPIAGDLLVEDVLTAHMHGWGLGPSGVMIVLGINEGTRYRDLNAEQRAQIRNAVTAMNR
ncbi:hypothetical protein ACWEK5_23480 [Rhodococcus koreensis]